MTLNDDNNLVDPPIPAPQLQYIQNLQDTHKTYTRFFDALLIPRPSHGAFFRDLKSFRCTPSSIALFSQSNAINKDETRAKYRQITQSYLQSPFAHPWCRKAMAGTASSKGWWGAQWSATGRTMSQEAKDQEEKLHRTLVPIWIVMRSRMFPGEEEVKTWYNEKTFEEDEKKRVSALELEDDGVRSQSVEIDVKSKVDEDENQEGTVQSKTKSGFDHPRVNPSKSCEILRQDIWDSDEAEDMERELAICDEQAAHAATNVFRLAAAGLLVNSMSRSQKWKLKRQLKKGR